MGCGVLGWAPSAFWKATPAEFFAGLDGYLEKTGAHAAPPMDATRLAELRSQFPDSHPRRRT
ncbi:MAG TPA: phage tail assembly chaperone [Sphingomonadales bacterium]|nr:phage tail assembly chaperone [Sphingomonadales bacterium]